MSKLAEPRNDATSSITPQPLKGPTNSTQRRTTIFSSKDQRTWPVISRPVSNSQSRRRHRHPHASFSRIHLHPEEQQAHGRRRERFRLYSVNSALEDHGMNVPVGKLMTPRARPMMRRILENCMLRDWVCAWKRSKYLV